MPANGLWPYLLQLCQAIWVFLSRRCLRRAVKNGDGGLLPTARQTAVLNGRPALVLKEFRATPGQYQGRSIPNGHTCEAAPTNSTSSLAQRTEPLRKLPNRVPAELSRGHSSQTSCLVPDSHAHKVSPTSISVSLSSTTRATQNATHIVLDMEPASQNSPSPNKGTEYAPDIHQPSTTDLPYTTNTTNSYKACDTSLDSVSSSASCYSTDDSSAVVTECEKSVSTVATSDAGVETTGLKTSRVASPTVCSIISELDRFEKALMNSNTLYAFNPLSAVSGQLSDALSSTSLHAECVPLPKTSDTPPTSKKRMSGSRFLSPQHKVRSSITPYPDIFDLSIYDRPASMLRNSMAAKSLSEPDVTAVVAFNVHTDDSVIIAPPPMTSSSVSSFHPKKDPPPERDLYRGAGYSRVVAVDSPTLRLSSTCSGAELKKPTRRNTIRMVHDMTDAKEDCIAAMLDEYRETMRVLRTTN